MIMPWPLLAGAIGSAALGWGVDKVFGSKAGDAFTKKREWADGWSVADIAGAALFSSAAGRVTGDSSPYSGTTYRPLTTAQASSGTETQLPWAFDPWLMYLKEQYQKNWDAGLWQTGASAYEGK